MVVKIYQIPAEPGIRHLNSMEEAGGLFMGTGMKDYCLLGEDGSLPHEKYVQVYRCNRPDNTGLEDLFYEFNMEHPQDYKSRSMSVSDAVEIDGRLFFCDSFGFKPAHWMYEEGEAL